MAKASNMERAQRVNAALAFLKQQDTASEAASSMEIHYGISRRQAYRYIREAQVVGKRMSVPQPKIAFTVKLSLDLIQSIRCYAKTTGHTLSEIVTQALESFLSKGRGRG